jgi:hypothetical protein
MPFCVAIRSVVVFAASSILALPVVHAQRAANPADSINVRLKTEHYAIAGSVSDERLREYGRALEYIYAEYDKGFAKLLDMPDQSAKSKSSSDKSRTPAGKSGAGRSSSRKPADPPGSGDSDDDLFSVVIFSNTKEYQSDTRRNLGHDAEHTIGMFIPTTRMLLIADQGNTRDTYEVLFHEAFHQFLNRHLKNPPMWLNEGLAVHYGSAMPSAHGVAFTNLPTSRWKVAREAIDAKKAVPLADVVAADRAKFYDPTPVKLDGFDDLRRQHLYYAQAYTLVHLLLNDAEGKKRLQNYIRDLAHDDGRNTVEITHKYFDEKTCEGLTQHWVRHVKSGPRSR